MYERVLLPVDGNTAESAALRQVGELANWVDAEVTVLNVADTTRDSVTLSGTQVVDALVESGEDVVRAVGEVLDGLGVDHRTDVVRGSPAAAIVDYAEAYDYDLVAMPTGAREGLSRYLLGSVSEKVVRLSSVPVLTVPMREDETVRVPFERILVPTDGSDAATRAASHAVDLAVAVGARVHVLSVVEDDSTLSFFEDDAANARERRARNAIDAVVSVADSRGVEETRTHVARGAPDEEILALVDAEEVDVVVMGTTGASGVDRILLGSVTARTVRSAPVPVITVADRSGD